MEYQLTETSPRIEERLEPFREVLGKDFAGYRNHLYRVLNFYLFFVRGNPSHLEEVSTALVYHDIGLWTHKKLAYLEPSIEQFEIDFKQKNWSLDRQLVRDLIFWHHKITAYRGQNAEWVDAFRKADWIDASMNLRKMGVPVNLIREVNDKFPNAGFYDRLKQLGPELSHGSVFGMLRSFERVYKY